MATSYNGWAVDDTGATIDQNFNINGIKYAGGVRAGDVAIVFRWFLSRLATLEAPRGPQQTPPSGECWGWEVRADRNNSSLWSCHASGTAVDHNATRHPNGSSAYYGWSADQVTQIRAWLNEVGVIAWGADFSGTKDPMHFEIEGSASEVQAAAMRLSGSVPPVNPPTPQPAEDEEMKLDVVRDDRDWDYAFNVATGVFFLIKDPDHYFFLQAAGVITPDHGSARHVADNLLTFIQGECARTAGVNPDKARIENIPPK